MNVAKQAVPSAGPPNGLPSKRDILASASPIRKEVDDIAGNDVPVASSSEPERKDGEDLLDSSDTAPACTTGGRNGSIGSINCRK